MPERFTLADALVSIVVLDLVKEKGETNFERFITRASTSNIPVAFYGASMSVLKDLYPKLVTRQGAYEQAANMLFERKITNPMLATYAVLYSETISSIKVWSESNKKLEEVQKTIEGFKSRAMEIRSSIDTVTSPKYRSDLGQELKQLVSELERLIDNESEAKKLVEEFRRLTINKCGHVVLLEEVPKKRDLKNRLREMLSGTYYSKSDLRETRVEVEEYFKDAKKVARMTLLANSPK